MKDSLVKVNNQIALHFQTFPPLFLPFLSFELSKLLLSFIFLLSSLFFPNLIGTRFNKLREVAELLRYNSTYISFMASCILLGLVNISDLGFEPVSTGEMVEWLN